MSYYSKAAPRLNKRIADALNVNASVISSKISDQIDQSNNGRTGVKYPNLPNRSSAPGEPPAYQRGRLRNSIAIVKEATPTDLTADTGPRKESFPDYYYAYVLEYGNRTGSLEQRPYMRPAADAARKHFRRSGLKVA